MNYYQERIETDSIIPAKIYIGKPQDTTCHYPLHWHTHLEFDLVLEGRISGKINGKQTEARAGEFFFVNSGDLHETAGYDRVTPMCSITILLSYPMLKDYCPDVDSYYFDFTGNEKAQANVKALILRCAELYEAKKEFYELEISIALREICLVLLQACKKKRQDHLFGRYEQKSMFHLKKAIAYLETHYENDISLNEIADEVGMSPTYFSRFFKKTTGETFYHYLTAIRLYYAHQELMNRDASITEIALNNGFSNVKAFIEAFKRVYHETPAKYKIRMERDYAKR
ncbi:AraC family transcriptional regulator [Gorillibacterium timonense]|uniref:AraC family transcriptional regulator n=1 Tax=Gorillibacterium timonense TaxID=1689269 RepID=UPI00071E0E8A|nr:AraC family transcriptional regulator [Gorillibacterium timonense]